MITVGQILGDAGKLDEVVNGELAFVISTEDMNLVEGVVIGEGEKREDSKPLFLREVVDMSETLDFENDLFFLLSRKTWDDAKNSKILWNSLIDDNGEPK